MASRVTLYRNKLKETNPQKYAEYLDNQKKKSKLRRDAIKNELKKRKPDKSVVQKKERERALARERQRRYAERKKAQNQNEGKSEKLRVRITHKKATRNSIELQRLKWRAAKQKERQNMTYQKKMAIRRKENERRRKKKSEKSCRNETHVPERIFSSPKAEWNVITDVRKLLPKSPRKFTKVIQNLIRNKISPRKRKAVQHLQNTQTTCIKRLKLSAKSKVGKTAIKVIATKLLKNASKRGVSRQMEINRKQVDNACRASLKLGRQKVNVKLIQNFYRREDISRVMPQKRYAMKCGPGYLLQVSLKSAYQQFKGEYPGEKVSFAKFASLRPKNVRLLKNMHGEFCMCEYCQNVRYKVLVLSRHCRDKSKKCTNENDITKIVLCSKSDSARFHALDCVKGNCQNCSNQETSLRGYFSYANEIQTITWNHWKKVTLENDKKRRILVTNTGSSQDLIDELVEDVLRPSVGVTFVQHLFEAHWQSHQFNCLKENLPENCVLSVMDFAKNRTVQYQDEIKSAYFGARQITVHPIVTYYHKEEHVIRDSLMFIFDDVTHDFHAVNHFSTLAERHIESKLGFKPMESFVFSDGCSSQYKSKGPFADLSLHTSMVNRNFYGSEHGKSEGDGETGILNRAVDRAVLGRKLIINSAMDMFEWCQTNLTSDDPLSQRHFFYVNSKDIDRDRPYTSVKTLPQTRQLHQIKNVPGKPYSLDMRKLSCFCKSCLGTCSQACSCANKDYVSSFQRKNLKPCATAVEVHVEEELTVQPSDLDVDEVVRTLMEFDQSDLSGVGADVAVAVETDLAGVDSEAGVAGNGAYTASEMAGVAGQTTGVTGDGAYMAGEMAGVVGEVAGDGAYMAGEMAGVAGDGAYKAGEMAGVAGDGAYMAGEMAGVAGDGAYKAGETAGVAGDGAYMAGEKTSVAGDGAYKAGEMAGVVGDGAYMTGEMAGVAGNGAYKAGKMAGVAGDGTNQAVMSSGQAGTSSGEILSVSAGNYFKVQHGSELYPAVVVDNPAGYDSPPEKTFWAHYFHPGLHAVDNQWVMDETVHLIPFEEILMKLDPPYIVCHGRRFMYHFVNFHD